MNKKHKLSLRNRPFTAIINGSKKIEIRANKIEGLVNYRQVSKGDLLLFKNEETQQIISCVVKRKSYYKSIRSLLKNEGTEYSLSSTNCIEQGIKSIESISNYKVLIPKYGVYAFEIELRNCCQHFV